MCDQTNVFDKYITMVASLYRRKSIQRREPGGFSGSRAGNFVSMSPT